MLKSKFFIYHNLGIMLLDDLVRILLFVLTMIFAYFYFSNINNYVNYYCKEVFEDSYIPEYEDKKIFRYDLGCLVLKDINGEFSEDYAIFRINEKLRFEEDDEGKHEIQFYKFKIYKEEKLDGINEEKVHRYVYITRQFYKYFCLPLGLLILGFLLLFRLFFDICIYIIRPLSNYKRLISLEIFDLYRVYVIKISMCLEGFSIALCFILYTFKFNSEGIKELREFESEKDVGVNILGYGVGLLVPAVVFVIAQICIMCTKLWNMEDDGVKDFHKHGVPFLIFVPNACFTLVAAHKCFQTEHILHTLFIVFIFIRFLSYIYLMFLISFDVIPSNAFGLGNDLFFLQKLFEKSGKRVEEARRTNINNIEKENSKLRKSEERENSYQEILRGQMQKVEDEEQATRTARKVNIQNKIDEKERKQWTKEQEELKRVEFGINLANEGARLEEERTRLEEERKEFEVEKAIIGEQNRRIIVREEEEALKYLCPLTLEIMRDPVVAADGITYERVAITNWLLTHDVSPVTNLSIQSTNLIPNIHFKNIISNLSQLA